MLEGKNPLIAFIRASTRSISVQSETKPALIKLLCQAWNAFARLLCVDLAESFTCPICGLSPTTIICDGTLIGFRKDLIQSIHDDNSHLQQGQVEKGSCHSSHIMLRSRQSRQLLQQYSGLNWERKVQRCPKELTTSELKQLQSLLKKEGANTLAQIIRRLSSQSTRRLAPQPYRKLSLSYH